MDAKEVKLTLKSIKENLDAKDFKSAIKLCKTVLKSDRNNYLALVFFGVALQETEQKDEAPKAFKKAIEVKPDNNLAWMGLATYYEKYQTADSNQDLLKAYERLIILETNINKCTDLIKKYENLAITMQDTVTSKVLFKALDEVSEEKKLLLKPCLLSVFSACPVSDKEISECKRALLSELAMTTLGSDSNLPHCRKYLEHLHKEGNLQQVLCEGNKIRTNYPNDLHILQYICKAYAELYSVSDDDSELSCNGAYTALLELTPDSYLGHLCKGIHELQQKNPINALESLRQSLSEDSGNGLTWFILCKCQIILYQFYDAETSAQEALKCLKYGSKNETLMQKAELWYIQSLSEQDEEEKLLEAVKLGSSFYEQKSDVNVLPFLVKALIKLNRVNECMEYLDVLKVKNNETATFLQCLCFRQNSQEYKEKMESLVKEYSESYDAWLELGRIYYSEKNRVSCLQCLLKSAKLNQWCYLSFLHLGHCYKDLYNDLEKSRRCYQKAFQLNPGCPEIGPCLSEVYRLLGKEDLNGQLLNLITTQTPKQKWGWLNLGIHYLSKNQYQNAVNSLRVATRLNPNDRMTWEMLADAYFYQGAYISAGKAYSRVIDLGSTSVYPLVQMAMVKHFMEEYDASIRSFREIIENHPQYLPGLKGHAEVCITLVKQCVARNLNGLAMDNCQEAVNSLIKCLEARKDLACIWKLLGDACVLFSDLPDKYVKLRVPTKMMSEQRRIREGQTEVVLNKTEVLILGSRSYCEALALNSDSSRLWYDLAICYNKMAVHSKLPEKKKEMRELACAAVKKSLLVNEKSWESWNMFGVISASPEIKDYPLAQHCFIRALDENDSSPVVWTNLGTLYLCLNDLKLANQSFTEAQRLDHDYVQCWIGQAMIAHMTGHHDAMDLFRHSNQLGTHPEGSLGYANMVCQTLLETKNKNDKNYIYSIKNMNAVSVACDALTWYIDRFTDNPCAYNMLGLLLERQKLYNPSCKAFQNAVSLLISSPRDKSQGDEQTDILDKALLNYGRSLTNVGKPEEAIEVLKQIRKANFVNQCALALAYFKAKKYEEAYSSYATTLEWLAPDSGFKSHILVAMATVVYMHQGMEDAKILLMQASRLKPPSVQGLFACCALGMLHSDLLFSELSLKELSQYKDEPKYLNHIAVFESYTYLFKGEKEKAIRAISKAIHRHPTQPSLWLSLSLLLLHLYPSFDSQSAANCAEVTIQIGRSEIDVSKIMSLVSLSNLLSDKGLKSLRSSQKAVHMFPHETENWVVLVASVLSKCLQQESSREVNWLKKTIAYIRRKLEASKAMTQWLSNNERKVTLMADELKG
ncbi:UNVERIFIED_CONTAM: hypothetical protein PYX00_000699 [Menopon gallinae]|uniref:Tetratricopeptide repeat protein 37 n=1 Tax=Menopon gallinae TaxID=328185 RepID=A0AAW2IAB8_9NEOP